jgi:hypothetical protein
MVAGWTARESNPQPSPCRGAALPVAPPAQWSHGRGSGTRTRQARRMRPHRSLISRRNVLCWGDRPDSNRLPPGSRPGVSSTSTSVTSFRPQSRRGRIRTFGILCVGEAVCPLTYSSFAGPGAAGVGRRGVEPRHPAVSARCRHRLAHALRARGPGSARTSSCRASTDRSTIRASGPWSRRRDSNPLLLGYEPSALPQGPHRHGVAVWAEGVEPSPSTWGADVLPGTPRPRVTLGCGGWCGRRESNPHPQHGALRSWSR